MRQGQFAQETLLQVYIDLWISRGAIPREVATAPAEPGAVLYGLYREIAVTVDGPAFAFVRCGRVRVLERRDTKMRVAAEFDAGELHGWIEAAQPGERDPPCDDPSELPRGYSAVYPGYKATAFRRLEQKGGEFFVKVNDGGSLVCESWKFGRKTRDKRSKALISQRADGVRKERGYYLVDNQIGLGSPVTYQGDSAMASSAIDGYMVVTANENRLLVVDVGALPADSRPVLAYRESTAEPWFLSRGACENAAAQTPARPAGGGLESWLD
jgi:hypothetical protein